MRRKLLLGCLCALAAWYAPAQPPDLKPLEGLAWRFIGPAIMGGRVTDVEGVPGDPAVIYAGFASGGLWKSTNGGHSWTPIFEDQGTYSIGDIALEPGNPEVVWVGTGESNTRNSVSFGDGVYKSTDGGKTWRHLGLKETERISRVLVHPSDPDTVWVGALGHAFGPHPERGVFLTRDGGRTWHKTLYIDEHHGVSDMDVDPRNPNIVFAAMWKFERKPWTHTSGSEQGGVFRSHDGGQTWKKLEKGLPKLMGRIGVKVAPSNPRVVYVIAESKDGTLFRSDDGGDSFRKVSDDREIVSRGFYYADLRVDPSNENRLYALATRLFLSVDGGKTWKSITGGTHVDYHALWIDPVNPKRLWQGNDGGLAVSHDGGETWQAVYNIALGQFYQIHADNRQPFYYVMGGLQDNGSWTGPSRTREPAGILNDDWRLVSFGDGFYIFNHPDEPDLYLSESQGGRVVRTDLRTREQQSVAVEAVGTAGGGAAEARYRFNWNAPLVPSPHDKNTVYTAGNVVFRSTDFGRTWRAISPDLTTDDKEKQKPAGGPVWFDNSTAEYHCTVLSLAESPVKPGMIWAGTDDGNLQLTTDGGKSWRNLIGNVPGIPPHSPVSHIEPSWTSPEVAYVAFDRHMFDDFRPYIFKTEDGGRTWTRISGDLPAKAYVHIVREDPRNPKLLYAGTELGLYASYDGGKHWRFLKLKNLPPVPVHDILVHPRENDLILGTHGRSIVILDDATPVQQWSPDLASREAHLFPVRPALRFATRMSRYGLGGAQFKGPNPPYGALITFYLKEDAPEKNPPKIEILDAAGKVIRTLDEVPRGKGVHRVAWDLRMDPPARRRPPEDDEEDFGAGLQGVHVLPGTYTVRLRVAGRAVEEKVEVRMDPTVRVTRAELEERFELAAKLREMVHEGNRSLKALDSLKHQLEQTAKLLQEQAPEKARQMGKTFEDYQKEIARVTETIGRPPGASTLEYGPRVVEKLVALYQAVEGPNAAPTDRQKEAAEELSLEFARRIEAVREFFRRTVADWNRALAAAGVPQLFVAELESTERRSR
ncbi:MAG: hypothetical protein RMK57_05775 [Bryobacterales bacterium]|nr:hypothetical protein [Bryobacterales bacterium]